MQENSQSGYRFSIQGTLEPQYTPESNADVNVNLSHHMAFYEKLT